MTQTLIQNQTSLQTAIHNNFVASIGVKLDRINYMYTSKKDKVWYITSYIPHLTSTNLIFRRWRTENAIQLHLVPTIKHVWDSISIIHFTGSYTSQLFALKKRFNNTKQARGPIKLYCNTFQGLWREIDFRRLNLVNCARDIQKYNSLLYEDRIFLDDIDDKLNKIGSDMLQTISFPTIEQA
ncbi:hypothetical protein CR513_17607, partial [Mucuna pruriens]